MKKETTNQTQETAKVVSRRKCATRNTCTQRDRFQQIHKLVLHQQEQKKTKPQTRRQKELLSTRAGISESGTGKIKPKSNETKRWRSKSDISDIRFWTSSRTLRSHKME